MSEKFCCVINLAKKRKNSRGKLRDANLTFNLFSFPSNLSFILHDFFFVSKIFSKYSENRSKRYSSVKRRLSCQKGREGGWRSYCLSESESWKLRTRSRHSLSLSTVVDYLHSIAGLSKRFPEATKREGEKASDFWSSLGNNSKPIVHNYTLVLQLS